MKNAGIVLMYNCGGPEYAKLRQIFAMLRLRMRPVEPNRYHIPLEELQRGEGEPVETDEAPIPERMLVFCGLGDKLLQQVLQVIRFAQLPPIPLKAVLTDVNREWDSRKLREELLKEREKKNRPVLAELCLKMDEKLRDKEILLNTVFDLMYVVESGWTERQREVIWDMLLHGDGQQNTAGRLDITQSTVQKTLAAGSYYTYESALRNAAKILGEIRDD